MVEQAGGGTVQAVHPVLTITETIGVLQRTVPGMPAGAVGIFDVQVDSELPAMLQKLRAYRGRSSQTQLGLRLLLLKRVRTGELRSATPDQFDLKRGLWLTPPQNVKQLQNSMRKAGKRPQVPPYIVPLSILAVEGIRYLLGDVKTAQWYLLTHRSDLKKPISGNILNSALRRRGYEDRLTGQGIRGTISTALNGIGYPTSVASPRYRHWRT